MSHSPELPIAIPRSLKTCVSLFLAEVFQGINLLPGYFEQVRFSWVHYWAPQLGYSPVLAILLAFQHDDNLSYFLLKFLTFQHIFRS